MKAKAGNWIVIEPLRVGGPKRQAFVLEVLGEGEHEHYRVRWSDDDHESIYFPGSDALIVHLLGEPVPRRRPKRPA